VAWSLLLLERGRASIGTKLNLKPVMALTMEGKIEDGTNATSTGYD